MLTQWHMLTRWHMLTEWHMRVSTRVRDEQFVRRQCRLGSLSLSRMISRWKSAAASKPL
jgi:hypothetical protein